MLPKILERLKGPVVVALTCIIALVPLAGRGADPLEIPAIVSLTGPAALIGKEEAESLAVVEGIVNSSGGIGGRPIKFAIADDGSNPQTTVQLFNALLARKAPVVIGPSTVGTCSAAAPLVQTNAVLYCLTPAYHPMPRSYVFSAGVSTSDMFAFAVEYLRKRGLRKVALVSTNDASGQDAERGIAAALQLPENRSMTLVASEHFAVGDLALNAQMAKIKAAGAQALITFNSGAPFGTVLHGMTDAGLDLPVATGAGALNDATMKQFAAYLPKELLIPGLPSDAPSALAGRRGPLATSVGAYLSAIRKAGLVPDHTLASAWDPAWIVVDALRKLGPNATAAQIWGAIEGLHGWAGANGVYDFRGGNQRGLTTASSVMVRWDAATSSWIAMSRLGGEPLR